jgi:outer membrane receptor protein involved in Fe transport
VGRLRSRGFELEASYRLRGSWLFTGSYTFDDATLIESDDPRLIGKQVRQVARHQYVLRTSFDRPSIVSSSIQARFVGDRYEEDLNTLPVEQLFVVDVMASRLVARWMEAFVTVENVFDEEYEVRLTSSGLVEIGAPRLVQAGLRLNF